MRGMLLAAGLGTRLGRVTARTPKCLVAVGGIPMLERVVERLKQAGVTQLAVNTHYLAPLVQTFIRERNNFGIEVEVFHEQRILGTGGGIRNARRFLESGGGDFIVHNADVYCELELGELLRRHRESAALATLAVLYRRTDSCLLRDASGAFRGLWKEGEPPPAAGLEPVTFTGIHVLSPRIFQYMNDEPEEFSILGPYVRALNAGERLVTQHIGDAYWMDIGTPAQLEELRKRLEPA